MLKQKRVAAKADKIKVFTAERKAKASGKEKRLMAHKDIERYSGELTERQKLILREIVDSHIKNGEPVGSKALTTLGDKVYSSATIRNEMAYLEEIGYLESPHTSAGRVPTELGYRFYVDWLRDRYEMTNRELETLNLMTSAKKSELDSILETATKLASSMTNYTALAVRPKRSRNVAERYETVYLNEYALLLVIMFSEDNVKTVRVKSPVRLSRQAVTALADVLNEHIANVPAEAITLPVIMKMEERLGRMSPVIGTVMKALYETMNEGGGDVHVEGMNNLLSYPEYSSIDSVKDLLSMLDKREDILELVSEADADDVNVYIGSENAVDTHGKSSLVFRTIKRGGEVVGAIGIIGPRRMDYSRVIALIEKIAGDISDGSDYKALLPPGADEEDGE